MYETPESGLEAIEHVLPTGHGCVLVVDDEADIVQVTQRLLERLGYDVVGATSGLEALELFRADPARFHVVLTDQTMPHLTSERLTQILRGIRADIPIILCTGFSQMMSAEKARDLGIDAFCLKPIGAYHLANTLHQVLTQSRQQNACHSNP